VLAAARALVKRGGYSAATVDAIAARSGVAKTTIYRRWPNRATLIVDVLADLSAEEVPISDRDEPLGALRTEMRLIAGLSDGVIGRLITALLAEAQDDSEVRSALVEGLFQPRRRAMAAVVVRAQQAGLIRPDLAPLTVVDLFVGPLFFRMFVRHEPLTAGFADRAFEHVMSGFGPRVDASPRTRRAARGRRASSS
jgi:AcrR family transcriptional regulator